MVGYQGPKNTDLRCAWRHARRIAALQYHPDRGGDPEQLDALLRGIDRRFMLAEHPENRYGNVYLGTDWLSTPAPKWQPIARVLRRTCRRVRPMVRRTRAQIPMGWPGSRRYFDL